MIWDQKFQKKKFQYEITTILFPTTEGNFLHISFIFLQNFFIWKITLKNS